MKPPRPDPAARKPRLWLWFVAIAILGVLMLLIAAATWQSRQLAGFEAALAEIARSGEPTTTAELEAFYVAPSAEEDTTQLWLTGASVFSGQAFANAAKDLPFVGTSEKVPPPGMPWSELEAAELLSKQHQADLDLLHQAAKRGGAARYPTTFAQLPGKLFPHLQDLRGVARVLALEAHVRAHRDDADGAVQAIETLLALAHSLENEPLMTSLTIRMVFDQMAGQRLTELLPHVEFAEDDLVRLQSRLEQIEYQSGLRRALLGERVVSQNAIQGLGTPALLFRAQFQQVHLEFMQQMIAATQQPWPRALEEARQVQAEVEAAKDNASGLGKMKYLLTAMAGNSLQFTVEAVGRSQARNDATIAAVAIERYRRQHGWLPIDLTQLVPEFLQGVPFDPFDGRPLKYVPSQDEYLIYNVGADGIDNGGQGDDRGKPDDPLRIPFKARAP